MDGTRSEPQRNAGLRHNLNVSRAAPPELPIAGSQLPSRTPDAIRSRPGKSGPAVSGGPAAGAAVGGVAVGRREGRREGRAQVTALVLSLRRRAEADVQEQLRRVKTHLELARRGEAQAQRQLEQAKQKLQALTGALVPGTFAQPAAVPLTATSAEWLASQAAQLLRQRQLVQKRHHELDLQTEQVHALLRQQSELHEALRLALALREAAELHESAELREGRRARAQRQRAQEEEARDRFLSAQRQSKTHR